MYQKAEIYLKAVTPYQVIIDDIKCRLEAEGLSISKETGDRSTCIIYASYEIDGRPFEAEVTYFTWPRIIKVSIELTVIEEPNERIVCSLFLNLINNRLCPGHFKIKNYSISPYDNPKGP